MFSDCLSKGLRYNSLPLEGMSVEIIEVGNCLIFYLSIQWRLYLNCGLSAPNSWLAGVYVTVLVYV
jgi:hypothetical protein